MIPPRMWHAGLMGPVLALMLAMAVGCSGSPAESGGEEAAAREPRGPKVESVPHPPAMQAKEEEPEEAPAAGEQLPADEEAAASYEVSTEGGVTTITGGGATVVMDESDGSVTIAGESASGGFTLGESASPPEGWLEEIPLPEAFTADQSLADRGKGLLVYGGASPEPLGTIAQLYRKNMQELGWSETLNMSQSIPEPMRMLQYERGGEAVVVRLSTADEGTRLHLTYQKATQ